MGIVALAFLAAKIAGPDGDDDVNFETDQFGCKVRQPFEFPFCISVLNDNVFPFDIAKLAQPLAKCFDPGRKKDAEVAIRIPIRGIPAGCCASTTAPQITNATMRATIPTDFGFWDFRF